MKSVPKLKFQNDILKIKVAFPYLYEQEYI